MTQKVLYAITCGALPARDVSRLVEAAQKRGWDTCVLATPSAMRFIDSAALAKQTGHPVRCDYKDPGDPDILPPPDAVIVAPATVRLPAIWNIQTSFAPPDRVMSVGIVTPVLHL